VLFDMDGTLVDTEPYWIDAEYELVASFGGTWSDEHAHSLVGNPLLTSADYIRAYGGVNLPSPEIVDRLLDIVIARSRHNLPWRPGALALLASARAAGVPCAMVTMSYASLAQTIADQLEPGTFTVFVTGDQVTRGKPDPEAYLTAAAKLGVDPAHCVAIEDSPAGVASAEAAGCAVLAVPCQVAIRPADTRTVLATLEGVTIEDLRALVTASV
jgi:HAD superfamily hydrolase (TIGR01509 family)